MRPQTSSRDPSGDSQTNSSRFASAAANDFAKEHGEAKSFAGAQPWVAAGPRAVASLQGKFYLRAL